MSKTIKNNDLYGLAKLVKSRMEKDKRLTGTYTYNNVNYDYSEIGYAFASGVVNLKSDVTVPTLSRSSSVTNGNVIKEDIVKSDYVDQAKRIIQYTKQNGKLPLYALTVKSQKKASISMFIYAFAKIIVWSNEHSKTYPNYCTYDTTVYAPNPTPTKKKYGHATKSGCDNRGQNNSVNCGPHSLQECIRNLTGKVITQRQLASWAGTGSGGTDHDGLNTAVAMAAKQLGVKLSVEWKSFSDVGWSGLKKIIASDNQDCVIHNLYRDRYGHYEVINKDYSNYCDVQNSLGDSCSSGCYCGYVEERSHSTFQSYINGISQKSVMIITRR